MYHNRIDLEKSHFACEIGNIYQPILQEQDELKEFIELEFREAIIRSCNRVNEKVEGDANCSQQSRLCPLKITVLLDYISASSQEIIGCSEKLLRIIIPLNLIEDYGLKETLKSGLDRFKLFLTSFEFGCLTKKENYNAYYDERKIVEYIWNS